MSLYQQYRAVRCGEIEAVSDGERGDLDIAIDIKNESNQSAAGFEVELYNLSEESWSTVKQNGGIRVILGWVGGAQETVCFGKIAQKWTEVDGGDTKYCLSGLDASADALNNYTGRTWRDAYIHEIVRDLATDQGLTIEAIDPVFKQYPSARARNFVCSPGKTVAAWLEELKAAAEEHTGESWTMYCEQGKFSFVRDSRKFESAVVLSYENTLLSLDEADDTDGPEDGQQYKFTSLMEPSIRNGSVVYVEDAAVTGAFTVTKVKHKSDSTIGTHETSGTLTPATNWGVSYGLDDTEDEAAIQDYKSLLRESGAL